MMRKAILILVLIVLIISSCNISIAKTFSKVNENKSPDITLNNGDFEYVDPEWSTFWTSEKPLSGIRYCGYQLLVDNKNNLIYVAGNTFNMLDAKYNYILQYDLNGNLKKYKSWEKLHISNGEHEQCNAMCVNDGNLYVAIANPDSRKLIVEKYDESFSEPKWHKTYDITGEPAKMIFYNNNLYIVVLERPHPTKVKFIKVSAGNGDLKWSNSIGKNARLSAHILPVGNHIYIGGSQKESPVSFDIYLLKFHVDGTLVGKITYNKKDWDNIFSLIYDGENLRAFFNTGYTCWSTDIAMVKFNKNLKQIGEPKLLVDVADCNWGNYAIIYKDDIYIVSNKMEEVGNNLFKKIAFLSKFNIDGDPIFNKVWARNTVSPFSTANGILGYDNNLFVSGTDSSRIDQNYGSNYLLKCNLDGSHPRNQIFSRFPILKSLIENLLSRFN
jgi:hypothetical protein